MEVNDLKIMAMLIGTVGTLVASLVFVIRGPLASLLDKQMSIMTANQTALHEMLAHCQEENATARSQFVEDLAKRDEFNYKLMGLVESLTDKVAQMNERLGSLQH